MVPNHNNAHAAFMCCILQVKVPYRADMTMLYFFFWMIPSNLR